MATQKIGCIVQYDLTLNPHLTERFRFREASFTRTINSRGDKIRSKMLLFPVDYEEVVDNAAMMKRNPIDDELRDKCTKWVEWANTADPAEYDPFA